MSTQREQERKGFAGIARGVMMKDYVRRNNTLVHIACAP